MIDLAWLGSLSRIEKVLEIGQSIVNQTNRKGKYRLSSLLSVL